jgi:threonine dehydratase
LASEESIKAAFRLILERMKIVIEPSAALPLAVLLENKERIANQRIGLILTGGNVDLPLGW